MFSLKKLLLSSILLLYYGLAPAQLKVNAGGTYLETGSGRPFLWLGDTAWELFHRLDRAEAELYLKDRAVKGFTVIQAVILAELDGIKTPNPYGHLPLLNNDPAQPNEAYFKHVDFIIKKAEQLGLVMALLPSWGDKWNIAEWGKGPELFNPVNARTFGKYIGSRYKNNRVVWMLGGDRPIRNTSDRMIITAMAEGLKEGDGGKHLMTFHPPGAKSSSDYFPDAGWIDFHISQTGHYSNSRNYEYNERHRALSPRRPHFDAEPRYEDHPDNFNPLKNGWMDDFDVRQTAYWSMLSGAMGHTYGNHNIWQFYTEEQVPVSWARTHWKTALNHPGAFQLGLMKKLFEQRSWYKLIPKQDIIEDDNPKNAEYRTASVSAEGDFLIVYIPYGQETTINTTAIAGTVLNTWLFNPRDGRTIHSGQAKNTGSIKIKPPSVGRGSDWVVIIDDAGKGLPDLYLK